MAPHGHPSLRNLFDDAPTPHIAHSPRTHHRDYYVATDGSFFGDGAGIGVIVETGDGDCLFRIARGDDAPDNNTAEYRALAVGLDSLSAHAPETARIGLLVDHDDLAENVNAATLGMESPEWPDRPTAIPEPGLDRWRAIRESLGSFADVRAACVGSDRNPAHVLANAPEEYGHVSGTPTRAAGREWEVPPASRADRHADD
ncbi:MAG: ribonuclease H [Halobacteriales archaeon]